MNDLTPFKRYHMDKVWRKDNPSRGRYQEFYQYDFDIAGQYENMGPDFEVIKILSEVLNALNIGNYEVKENGLFVQTGDKIGTFVKIKGSPLELLSKIMVGSEGSELLKRNASKEALGDLSVLFEAVDKSRCIEKVVFYQSLARGLDYYTRVIFEVAFKRGVQNFELRTDVNDVDVLFGRFDLPV
ncbi:hypothetical protein REPUB_Repub06bG0098300 [Reevesia pubescens]